MTGTIVAYAIAFGVAVVLAVSSRWWLPVRAGLAVAMAALVFVTYRSVGDLRGLPTYDAPPARFRLHWAEVREPSKDGEDPGSIFLWISEPDEDWYLVGMPRAHEVPWTPELAQSVAEAMGPIADAEQDAGEITKHVEITDPADRLASAVTARQGDGQGGGTELGERFLPTGFGDLTFGEELAPVQPEKQGD